MQLEIGDLVKIEGIILESATNGYTQLKCLKTNETLLTEKKNLIFIARPNKDTIEISREQLETFLHRWDYSQKLTIEDAWTELSRL